MKQRFIEKIKVTYKALSTMKKAMEQAYSRKYELEKTKEVREYLKIVKQVESYEQRSLTKIKHMFEKDLIDIAVQSEMVDEPNPIYVCLGTYKHSASNDILVDQNSMLADYKIYCDLKKGSLQSAFKLAINECEDFEKNSIVLYPSKHTSGLDYYCFLRKQFFETAISFDDNYVNKKVL